MLLREAGTPGLVVLLTAALGGVVAAIASILLAFGWRVPPPVPLAAAALPGSVAVLHGVWARDLTAILALSSPADMAAGIAHQIAQTLDTRLLVGVVVVPLAAGLVGCAVAGGVRGPRSLVGMALAAVAVVGEVGLGLGLIAEGQPGAAVATATVAGALGLAVIAAGAAGDPEKGGPEAAITAGFLYAIAMGAWWCAVHASGVAEIFQVIATVDPDQKSLMLAVGLRELWLDRWLGVGAVVLPLLPVVGGVIAGRVALGRRVAWLLLGLPLWLVPLALVLDDPPAAQLRALLAAGF